MKPNRIFLVRHGESEGNVNKQIYKDVPDYALQLTEVGKYQAFSAGLKISSIISPFITEANRPSAKFYFSPFWRTRQTFIEISKNVDVIDGYEDPRLREQEWGQNMESREGYKDKIEEYRDSYGHFYYRFRDGGESCADVFDRVSDFMNTLHRDFEKEDFPKNVVIVSHGMSLRLFLMRWFHCTVEEFERWGNLKNGEVLLLEKNDKEKYNLVTPLRTHKLRHNFQFDWGVYKEYGRTKLPIVNP